MKIIMNVKLKEGYEKWKNLFLQMLFVIFQITYISFCLVKSKIIIFTNLWRLYYSVKLNLSKKIIIINKQQF